MLAAPVEALRGAGLSAAKTASIRDLAEHVLAGTVVLDRVGRRSDDQIVEQLTQVRGIGRWTAEMFLMFQLGRLDVWPVDDLGVRKGYARLYDLAGDRRRRACSSRSASRSGPTARSLRGTAGAPSTTRSCPADRHRHRRRRGARATAPTSRPRARRTAASPRRRRRSSTLAGSSTGHGVELTVGAGHELRAVELVEPVGHAHTVEEVRVVHRVGVAVRDRDVECFETALLEPGVFDRVLRDEPGGA